MKKTERFKREGEHLPLNQLREELRRENERRERAGEKKLVDSYIKRNNIPAFPRPELHVSHISHCTDLTGLTGIRRDGGFKDPKDLNVVWFSLMVSPHELRDAETRPVTLVRPGGAEEPLRPQRRPQAEEEPLEEQFSRLTVSETELLLQSFATSSAFKSKSRYGSFRFTFSLRDVLHKYRQKFCGGARPVFRVYQTVLYQQEVMYAVLVHSPVNENMFSDLPLLEDTPHCICAFREKPQPHFVWRPQAMSETHKFELVENQGHIATQRVCCKRFVWDHVALALHVGDEVLTFGDQDLRSSLRFCDRDYPPVRRATRFDAQAEVKKLWPDHGDLQKFNEAELNVTDSRATPNLSRATPNLSRATPNLSRATPTSTTQDKDDKTEAVKILMEEVHNKLKDCNHDVAAFLRKSISELDEEKKELVGVFGRSGLGKSSLINAVLDEEGLLPTNKYEACTSVIIKAEANSENNTFMAVVEFISVEDFESEMDLLSPYFGPEGEDCEEEYDSKLTALFGEEWKKQPLNSFKKTSEYKRMKKIVENKTKGISYSESQKKTFREELERYTNAACEDDEGEDDEGASAKPWPPRLWPVVKSVTVKVPNNDLLRHVTLVDLPGTGDYNKTRNEMWKQMLSSCGTVWVVAGPNRAASETEAWQIMDSAWRHMGHGGECHTIHFICTKMDQITDELVNPDLCSNLRAANSVIVKNCRG